MVVLPGCDRPDPRLVALSTAPELAPVLDGYFRAGGPENLRRMLGRLAAEIGFAITRRAARDPAARVRVVPRLRAAGPRHRFVRRRIAVGLAARSPFDTRAEPARADPGLPLRRARRRRRARQRACGRPATARHRHAHDGGGEPEGSGGGRGGAGGDRAPQAGSRRRRHRLLGPRGAGFVLDEADCPVLQAFTVGSPQEAWEASARGMNAADLAMQVALPEFDGRLSGFPISFKQDAEAAGGSRRAPRGALRPGDRRARRPGRRVAPPGRDAPRKTPDRRGAVRLPVPRRARRLRGGARYARERPRDRVGPGGGRLPRAHRCRRPPR